MPQTVSLLFPQGETQFWLTEQTFAVGDKVTRGGETWIITGVGNFNRDGKELAVTLRLDDESQS